MAQVDFSNAALIPPSNGESQWSAAYLTLASSSFYANGAKCNRNETYNRITQTLDKVSFVYTGEFTASGTNFSIGSTNTAAIWVVSNISYSNGDTYSFQIDLDLSIG